jgi:hypothetical protein
LVTDSDFSRIWFWAACNRSQALRLRHKSESICNVSFQFLLWLAVLLTGWKVISTGALSRVIVSSSDYQLLLVYCYLYHCCTYWMHQTTTTYSDLAVVGWRCTKDQTRLKTFSTVREQNITEVNYVCSYTHYIVVQDRNI